MEEEEKYIKVRQVTIASLNENVNVLSSSDDENLEYISELALKLLKRIKQNGKV